MKAFSESDSRSPIFFALFPGVDQPHGSRELAKSWVIHLKREILSIFPWAKDKNLLQVLR